MKQRVGVMGGTFDPIHLGHLAIAEAAFIEFQLEKVIFIPACEPVHKPKWAITEAKHRFAMTLLATAANPHFHVSSIEIDRSGPSYTSETLAELKSQFGEDTEIFFILGADAIADLPTWHDARASNFANLLAQFALAWTMAHLKRREIILARSQREKFIS